MVSLPVLDGVEHRFIDLPGGVTIHVADAGPADGPAVMLVHGFPQNWWQWHELIGPLAADGYRVLCPDLRGAGWSSAPRSRYLKNDMADDLAAVIDRLGLGPVKLVAHDWGGPVAFIMMLRHPAKVSGFFGLNTVGPWTSRDLRTIRHLWRFGYQIPISLPVVGPRVIAHPSHAIPECWCHGWAPGSRCRTMTSSSTRNACASLGMRWPGRAGIAAFKPPRHCAGCAANTTMRESMCRFAGCMARATL